MPNSAINPITADTLKVIPASRTARIPPTREKGRFNITSNAGLNEPKALNQVDPVPNSVGDWLPERASHNKLNLCLLAFMKDDASRNPYTLIDEFGISIINVRKGQKCLTFKESIT